MKLELLLLSIAPGIAFGLWIYLKDKYDKEPLYLLFKVFIFGCLCTIPTLIVENILTHFNIFNGLLSVAYISFIIAGFTEEYFKRLVVLKSAFSSKYFNEKLDGIVYCVFSALGFATIENILYVFFNTSIEAFQIGINRALISVPAHMLFGVTMGYYLSLYKYCNDDNIKRKSYLSKSLYVPILLHGLFDFILMSNLSWAMIVFIIYVLYLWKINLDKLDEYTKDSKYQYIRKHRRKDLK